MPFKSSAQRRYIFMQARNGSAWAKKFIKDSGYGDDMPKVKRKRKKVKRAS